MQLHNSLKIDLPLEDNEVERETPLNKIEII